MSAGYNSDETIGVDPALSIIQCNGGGGRDTTLNVDNNSIVLEQAMLKEENASYTSDYSSIIGDKKTTSNRCYCGEPRNLNEVELQCGFCCKFFHQRCISIATAKMMPFATNYQFFCKTCSAKSVEVFSQKQASFSQLCVSAIANLSMREDPKLIRKIPFFFSRDKEIIPFIDTHWELLTTAPRKTRSTWHVSINKALAKDDDFIMNEHGCYGLRRYDLESIGSVHESLRVILTPTRSSGDSGKHGSPSLADTPPSTSKRSSKRKSTDSSVHRGRRPIEKIVPLCYPTDYPINKDNYRYYLAEPDPHSCVLSPSDSPQSTSRDYAGQSHRVYLEKTPLLSINDREQVLQLNENRLTVTGMKGYSMIRSSNYVSYGTWYYEVKILNQPDNSCSRIGWSTSLGNLRAPCGYDHFGYSWRAKKGTVFHCSRGLHYDGRGYRPHDVIGILIHLPCDDVTMKLPKDYRHLPLIKYRNFLYFEEHESPESEVRELIPLKGSHIVFYTNGECNGVAFSDVYRGRYHAAISLYKGMTVKVNFGPNLEHLDDVREQYPNAEPLYFADNAVEYGLSDILFHVSERLATVDTDSPNTTLDFTSLPRKL